jgi:hypothetical protein
MKLRRTSRISRITIEENSKQLAYLVNGLTYSCSLKRVLHQMISSEIKLFWIPKRTHAKRLLPSKFVPVNSKRCITCA